MRHLSSRELDELADRLIENDKAMRRAIADFRATLNLSPSGVIISDDAGHIMFWNRATARIFGYREDEAFSLLIEDLMPERYRARHRTGLDRLASGGPSRLIGHVLHISGLRKSGEEFSMEMQLGSYLEDGSKSLRFVAYISDLTETSEVMEIQ